MGNNFLIAGIGNTLRGDDGIGAYICTGIDALKIDGVQTFTTQQLHVEMLEEFLQFDCIIFADASITGEAVIFHPLVVDEIQAVSTSHHANANMLVALAWQLYQKKLPAMLCAVRGENFNIGEKLSANAKKNADEAISIIRNFIGSGVY